MSILLTILYRAFNQVLKADRINFGVGEQYEIADNTADEWQQRVDDVVAGTADAA